MATKYKEEIKGALIATGMWAIIMNLFPTIGTIYNSFTASIPLALLAIAIGVFWK